MEDADFKPPEAELDEYHPKATRTLFVGNLEKDITNEELREIFHAYGDILVNKHFVSRSPGLEQNVLKSFFAESVSLLFRMLTSRSKEQYPPMHLSSIPTFKAL